MHLIDAPPLGGEAQAAAASCSPMGQQLSGPCRQAAPHEQRLRWKAARGGMAWVQGSHTQASAQCVHQAAVVQ
jgi:hypothetical protein